MTDVDLDRHVIGRIVLEMGLWWRWWMPPRTLRDHHRRVDVRVEQVVDVGGGDLDLAHGRRVLRGLDVRLR